jgi:NADH-quinone oxidoreductase E subunit
MTLSETALREIEDIKGKYPEPRSALIPSLYIAEREFGWLSAGALLSLADALELPPAVVRGTATFYHLYRHREMGRHLIQLCTNVSCMILGAEQLQELLKRKYGLEPGGTTEDGRFSLLIMECIGVCEGAPAMQIDTDLYQDLSEERLDEILASYG